MEGVRQKTTDIAVKGFTNRGEGSSHQGLSPSLAMGFQHALLKIYYFIRFVEGGGSTPDCAWGLLLTVLRDQTRISRV